MKTLRRSLLGFLCLLAVPTSLFAVVQPTPVIDAVQNYSGPLVVFWNCNGAITAGTDYYVFYSTLPVLNDTPANLLANEYVETKVVTYSGSRGMYAVVSSFKGATLTKGQLLHFRIGAYNAGDWSAALSNESSRDSTPQAIAVQSFNMRVDGQPGSTIDYDSSTVVFSCNLRGISGDPFLFSNGVSIDIQNHLDGQTIFSVNPRLQVAVNISSTNFSACTSSYTWNGSIPNHKDDKHNGMFDIIATPVNDDGSLATFGLGYASVRVDVVHMNAGRGLVYTTLGKGDIHYGPPFLFEFYLTKSAFVTLQIWDKHQTETAADDTLVKSVALNIPKPAGDESAATADWDKVPFTITWEGRNEDGLIPSNDIYYYTLSSAEFWNEPGSGYDAAATDRSQTFAGNIAFDVLRLINIASSGITDANPVAHIKYTLAGANSAMGGATIKIVICTPGTTFYMAAGSGSIAVMNGAETYDYVPGDPIPYDTSRIRKIFQFARSAGDLDEVWDGTDARKKGLANDNYVFALSGTDDSGNHAIDNSGNDRIMIGNITIDRTAPQTAIDSTPPSVVSASVGNTALSINGNTTISSAFNAITIVLTDGGGSGIDFAASTVTLAGTSSQIPLTVTNNGTDTMNLSFPTQTTSGVYVLRIRPKDMIGNSPSDTVYTFTANITEESTAANAAPISATMYAYPNPAKGADKVTFAYQVPAAPTGIKLEIYNILGELIYEDDWTENATGNRTHDWDITNKAETKLASGVYLYRLIDENRKADKKLKKLVVIQ